MISRVVKYDENDNVIYDGPARRGTDQEIKKSGLPFGLVPGDLFKISAIIISCIVFVVKTDQRILSLEEAVKYSQTFFRNSDGFNSSLFGVQFEGGKPIDNQFNISKLKKRGLFNN